MQWRPANAPGRRGAARERADGVREHAELERAPEPHVPEERPRGRLGVAGEFQSFLFFFNKSQLEEFVALSSTEVVFCTAEICFRL